VNQVIFPLVAGGLENESDRGHPVPPMLRLLAALRFYAAGCFQVGGILFFNEFQRTFLIQEEKKLYFWNIFCLVIGDPGERRGKLMVALTTVNLPTSLPAPFI